MDINNRRGQTLVETLVLSLFVLIFFVSMETCHEKTQSHYNRYKIQRKNSWR